MRGIRLCLAFRREEPCRYGHSDHYNESDDDAPTVREWRLASGSSRENHRPLVMERNLPVCHIGYCCEELKSWGAFLGLDLGKVSQAYEVMSPF